MKIYIAADAWNLSNVATKNSLYCQVLTHSLAILVTQTRGIKIRAMSKFINFNSSCYLYLNNDHFLSVEGGSQTLTRRSYQKSAQNSIRLTLEDEATHQINIMTTLQNDTLECRATMNRQYQIQSLQYQLQYQNFSSCCA